MKRKHIGKRIGAFFMAVALTAMAIPQPNMEVYAAELPDVTQFATADELKTFNTDDMDGSISAVKVYYGENNQQWWIVGSQSDNSLTLFSASSMGNGIQFEADYNNNKAYDSSWNCTYPDGEPTEVFPNHYGASYIRNVTLKEMETSFFTDSERALMNETTIYTDDTKNNRIYSITDKLYLAYGDQEDYEHITVGKNSANDLNDGLRIDPSYWGEAILELFWIRSPFVSNDDPYDGSNILTAWPSASYPGFNGARTDNDSLEHIRPAFELNSSTILFGSAVPSATTDGAVTLEDADGNGAFTLRYASGSLGTAEITSDKTQVNVSDVPQGTYLVVQNSDGAYAKSVSGTQTISASDMNVDSFENCKVWLETTDSDQRMTYATMATYKTNYTVKVVENTGLKVISGNAEQAVAIGAEVSPIEIAVQDGYYLSEDYLMNLQGLNGLQVTEIDKGKGFIISGIPTEDVNITLPEATAEVPDTYTLTVNLNGGSGSATGGEYPAGEVVNIDAGSRSSYRFSGWSSSNGGTFADASSVSTTFTMPAADTTITATWSYNGGGGSGYIYYTITASAGEGGTITPDGTGRVLRGTDKTFTITPDRDYVVSDVLVDGKSVGAVTSYTFETVREDHSIEAIFELSEEAQEAIRNEKLKEGVKNTTIRLYSTLGNGFIRLDWEKSPGYKVDYYEVYKSTKRYSGYGIEPYFETKQGGLTGWYKNTKELKKGVRYYYKVRGTREIAGETVYTKWSNKAWRLVK